MNVNKIIFLSLMLTLLLLISTTSSGIISKYNDSEAQRFFASVKPEDRDDFIRHYLMEGLKANNLRHSKIETREFYDGVSAPENFAINLVAWTKDEFKMTDSDIAVLAQEDQVCFPNGFCYNPRDVGSNCCPF
ncbi:hypothetical protein PVAND_007707 [Polypedilum vanderplanki]|uniref:Uncharacterized protein n=1 Tax=Polypedilum vanderplanki TaxID=319348 RepID=A0A9J6C764_POLVA|nr:hypothetical protein PVAND_007707 [Polypedilum vanderplanki]